MNEPKRPDQRFRKCERIRLRSDFERIYAARKSASNERLTVFVLPNGLRHARLGLSVSRRVGTAVTRNLIRRRIKEAFRLNKTKLPAGIDLLCVVKPGPAATFQQYSADLCVLSAKASAKNEPRP